MMCAALCVVRDRPEPDREIQMTTVALVLKNRFVVRTVRFCRML